MKVFVTGATGYIGGSVAHRLIEVGHEVVGLARTEEAAAKLRERGIAPYSGTLTDHDRLVAAAQDADAVVNAADSDNPWVVASMLSALEGTGKLFVQTSGSSIVGDRAAGQRSELIFHEDTPLKPSFEKAGRVAIDREVLSAAHRGVRSVVLCNTLIYGRGLGGHEDSIHVPWMIEQAKRDGVARHIGRGENVWSTVHVEDMADLYLLAIERAPAGSFFYVENGEEVSLRSMAEAVSRMLGLGGSTEEWTLGAAIEEWSAEGAIFAFGSNSRVRTDKARKMLGWDPSAPSLLEEIENGYYRNKHNPWSQSSSVETNNPEQFRNAPDIATSESAEGS